MSRSRRIQGDGTSEADWESWLTSAPVAARRWAVCAIRRRRLVVVAPHPDDEVLACGALVAAHRRGKGDTLVIVVTDGERSHLTSDRWRMREMGATRRRESAQGLRKLGVSADQIVRLGIPDGRIESRAHALTAALKALLRPTDVVVTTWRFDGHPDHEACGRRVAGVCANLGAMLLEAPVWMWHWATPGDDRVPWRRLHGVAPGSNAVGNKQSALAFHVSQLGDRSAALGPVLNPAILDRARRPLEYFIS